MPLIDVHIVRGIFTAEQKRDIITKLTDAMVSIEGERVRELTHVKINELDGADWGIGGKPFTVATSGPSVERRRD